MEFRYNFDSAPKANPDAVVTGGAGSKYRFTVLTDRLVRYEWSEDGGFEDRASTFAIFRDFPVPDFRVVDEEDNLEIITKHFHLTYDKKAFSSEGLTLVVSDGTWRYDGQSFGDLGGTARTLDTADGRIPLAPGVLSKRPWAVLEDSESMLFDEDGFVAGRTPGRRDGYVFAYNGDHKAAIKDFYRISGNQPLLPRWVLGNWWSRYHAYSADEYLNLMDRFKEEEIPLVVGVIDMDWHRVEDVPAQYGSGWTGYTWNKELFPDPEGFLRELHKRGLKTALNDHPADGVRAFEEPYEAVAKYLKFDTSNKDPIKFDPTDRKFLDAYFDVLKAGFEKQGLDFWWIDWQQGTKTKIPGIDPLWVLNHFHYLNSEKDIDNLEKPITFSRFAGPGSHRYPIGFSGDTLITWASLHFQPEFTATASNIGYGWWSHDIGGHYWGQRSNERLARWVQLGTFSPILRLHSEKSRWDGKEPWNYENETYRVMKEFLVLRHRLIPFLYTMNVRASYDSEPIVQPMYWNHKDSAAYNYPNQFYFGPDLIVAPITSPHSPSSLLASTRGWLPPGRYVDIFSPSLVYDGGREIKFHRTLSKFPVFAKEGSILPVDASPVLTNGVSNPSDMEIMLVVGADASFELIEEDESAKREVRPDPSSFIRTPITWDQKTGRLTVGPASKRTGKSRNWIVKLLGHTKSDLSGLVPPEAILKKDNSTMIKLGAAKDGQALEVVLGPDLRLDIVDIPSRVHEVLYRGETKHLPKEAVWQLVVESKDPLHIRQNRLHEMDIDADLRDAVIEVWLADERALASARELQLRSRLSGRSADSDGSYVVL
ncbi:glycoside hydrolase family 31 protein [Thozetella sp. PMI_491]|nr:glycoside hydrolase family 31 protein [Thozetella sp. PMI_491]